jgi:hypothetical protein
MRFSRGRGKCRGPLPWHPPESHGCGWRFDVYRTRSGGANADSGLPRSCKPSCERVPKRERAGTKASHESPIRADLVLKVCRLCYAVSGIIVVSGSLHFEGASVSAQVELDVNTFAVPAQTSFSPSRPEGVLPVESLDHRHTEFLSEVGAHLDAISVFEGALDMLDGSHVHEVNLKTRVRVREIPDGSRPLPRGDTAPLGTHFAAGRSVGCWLTLRQVRRRRVDGKRSNRGLPNGQSREHENNEGGCDFHSSPVLLRSPDPRWGHNDPISANSRIGFWARNSWASFSAPADCCIAHGAQRQSLLPCTLPPLASSDARHQTLPINPLCRPRKKSLSRPAKATPESGVERSLLRKFLPCFTGYRTSRSWRER